MVCLMPQSQVSGSVENPHFNMLTLDRPTWVRNRLNAFQVIQGSMIGVNICKITRRCVLDMVDIATKMELALAIRLVSRVDLYTE